MKIKTENENENKNVGVINNKFLNLNRSKLLFKDRQKDRYNMHEKE